MKMLLLQSESLKDLKLFAKLAKRIGIKSHFIKNNEIEDINLINAMKKGRTREYVDTGAYLRRISK